MSWSTRVWHNLGTTKKLNFIPAIVPWVADCIRLELRATGARLKFLPAQQVLIFIQSAEDLVFDEKVPGRAGTPFLSTPEPTVSILKLRCLAPPVDYWAKQPKAQGQAKVVGVRTQIRLGTHQFRQLFLPPLPTGAGITPERGALVFLPFPQTCS